MYRCEYLNIIKEKIFMSNIFEIADYIIDNCATVRDAAKVFGISKSCVHNKMRNTLKKIDMNRYQLVDEVLSENLATRHIRGGESTKQKYINLHNSTDVEKDIVLTNNVEKEDKNMSENVVGIDGKKYENAVV